MSLRILHVVGARPNFMKASPLIRAFESYETVAQSLVHTGQHYDVSMSDVFFTQLGLPQPDANLGIGSGTHAEQTAHTMLSLERVVLQWRPDWVMAYGDVNSTLAAALVCSKVGTPIAHVEAGLRSFDRTMPEELNRVVTDQLSTVLFTPSADADENLAREGIPAERVRLVGNVMIDTLVRLLPVARPPEALSLRKPYALVTLHRPSNVDCPVALRSIVDVLVSLSRVLPIVFPIHPRTRNRVAECGILVPESGNLQLIDPVGYLEFLALQRDAKVVITDSGGIQEETTYLGVPCLTLRDSTERPITVTTGTNTLIGRDIQRLYSEVSKIMAGRAKQGTVPFLWDGKAAERIATVIVG